MGNIKIEFLNANLLGDYITTQEIKDIVDVMYRWSDASFLIEISGKKGKGGVRGLHQLNSINNAHMITLFVNNIISSVDRKRRVGGNFPAKDIRTGIAMVLTHEVQHANQARLHGSNEIFYTKKVYASRPCEVEARNFVDENMHIINSVLCTTNHSAHLHKGEHIPLADEIKDVAALFECCDDVSIGDIVCELRNSGINNAKNLQSIVKSLNDNGIIVNRK